MSVSKIRATRWVMGDEHLSRRENIRTNKGSSLYPGAGLFSINAPLSITASFTAYTDDRRLFIEVPPVTATCERRDGKNGTGPHFMCHRYGISCTHLLRPLPLARACVSCPLCFFVLLQLQCICVILVFLGVFTNNCSCNRVARRRVGAQRSIITATATDGHLVKLYRCGGE